jgi:hypothetical protein
MIIRRFFALLLVCVPAACAPMVTHGPRVQPGTHIMVTGGGGYSPCDTLTCSLELLPQAALGLRTGRAPSGTRPGLGLGLNLALNLVSSEVDLYAQAPTDPARFDAGAGVLLSGAHLMPYVQIGRMRDDGSGFYTTQGFAWMSRRQTSYGLAGAHEEEAPDEVQPRYWAPSVAYRTGGQYGMHLYLSGAFGTAAEFSWPRNFEGEIQQTGSQPVRVLMAGVVFEGAPADLLRAIPILLP